MLATLSLSQEWLNFWSGAFGQRISIILVIVGVVIFAYGLLKAIMALFHHQHRQAGMEILVAVVVAAFCVHPQWFAPILRFVQTL